MIEKGDVQLSFNIPNKDAKELADKVDVYSTPIENCMHCVGLNYTFEPFQDPNVRKAVAYSIPYEEIFQAAAYGRGARLWGGPETIDSIEWPRKSPYFTDLDKAKDLMAKSGFSEGFSVPFSISLGLADWMEPTALLIQENLEKIGISTEIEKIPEEAPAPPGKLRWVAEYARLLFLLGIQKWASVQFLQLHEPGD